MELINIGPISIQKLMEYNPEQIISLDKKTISDQVILASYNTVSQPYPYQTRTTILSFLEIWISNLLILPSDEDDKRLFFIDNAMDGIELWLENGILKSKIEDRAGGNILQEVDYLTCLTQSMKILKSELLIAKKETRLHMSGLDKIKIPVHIYF